MTFVHVLHVQTSGTTLGGSSSPDPFPHLSPAVYMCYIPIKIIRKEINLHLRHYTYSD